MIKIVASDIDGTLLRYGANELDPELFDIIRQLKKQGIHFVAASGRQYASLRNLFEPVKDEISYITENGSLCIHDGEIISRGTIDRELGIRIFEEVRTREHCDAVLSCEDTCYVETKDKEFIRHLVEDMSNDVTCVDDLSTVTSPFLKIAIFDNVTPEETFLHFREEFKSDIKVVTSGNEWVDFISPEANKGTALQVFLDYFHLVPEEAMAFGDQHNDIEMLHLAGEGYAMSDAAPGVASHSTYVTDSVIETLKELLR